MVIIFTKRFHICLEIVRKGGNCIIWLLQPLWYRIQQDKCTHDDKESDKERKLRNYKLYHSNVTTYAVTIFTKKIAFTFPSNE